MNPQHRKRFVILGTTLLWSAFLLCNLLLIASMYAALDLLGVLLLLFVFLGEFVLLVRHVKLVAQWRSVLALWAIYSLARIAAFALNEAGQGTAASIAMLVALYMMFAGWFAIVALAIRRDVSVVYLAIAWLAGPVLLRAQIMASGGVMAWLTAGRGADAAAIEPFNIMEPVVMMLSCMITMALLTFLPHFVVLVWREWRGVTASAPQAPVDPVGDAHALGSPGMAP
jgi:hypothetical protein